MWLRYKKRVKYYVFIDDNGREYASRYLFWRREPIREFYEWEWYERWVGKKKYQKKPHHKKKSQEEKDKLEAKKKFKNKHKDKKKAGLGNSWSGRGCPKWLKRHCNKKHRQWERRCIERGQYDRMGTWNWKRKDIFDPWIWS